MHNEAIWLSGKNGDILFQADPGTTFELKYISENSSKILACTGSGNIFTMLVGTPDVCKDVMSKLINAIKNGDQIFSFDNHN